MSKIYNAVSKERHWPFLGVPVILCVFCFRIYMNESVLSPRAKNGQ